MDFQAAVRGRRMVRSFTSEPVALATVTRLVDLARRAPSAGNTQATDIVALTAPEARARYWDLTLPEPRRATFRWPGLVAAPVLLLVVVDPDAYVARYAEPDKAGTGLGSGTEAWPVPYWWVDAGAAAEHILLGAVDGGLGACLFGPFGHEAAVARAFGVPTGRRIVATIAIGHPPEDTGPPGRSANRRRRRVESMMHLDGWGSS